MNKIRIGIICPSEIAFRRFMPALMKNPELEYAGVAYARPEERLPGGGADTPAPAGSVSKAGKFQEAYGGKVFEGYRDIVTSEETDAIYIPLPPALHYRWARLALESGKHVFLEKPSTTSAADTKELAALAQSKGLALHENYMFAYHGQLEAVREIADCGRLGDIRLYRIAFGFPARGRGDFRYDKALGGGALLDCGGYTLKLADMLLGGNARVAYAQLNGKDGYDVDIYGSGALVNADGAAAQVSFGMDNAYKCELEIWGSRGSLRTGRIFTAPAGYTPTAEIESADGAETVRLPEDDSFLASIARFRACVHDGEAREESYRMLNRQAELVESFRELARAHGGI